ncbi:hypothetical protein AB1Y20_005545 [Prymnesium parvum]|uniref:EngB-type G domain-containing protein n=1 Tax=Prymnesium parvum TaxID=97485 RepID=A0AB34J4H5_PRYPA
MLRARRDAAFPRLAARALRRLLHDEPPPLIPRKGERVDSVSEDILLERRLHEQRMLHASVPAAVIAEVERLGLGRRKGFHDQPAARLRRAQVLQRIGGGGRLVGKAAHGGAVEWLRLNSSRLPEVALLGHSNCGKSALLNALSGAPVRNGGIAEVSARAGWTAELGFYRVQPYREAGQKAAVAAGGVEEQSALERNLARKGGGVLLVDTPGYGFAVGDKMQLRQWRKVLQEYLTHSAQLRLAVLLVDATRGVCAEDERVVRFLRRSGVPLLPALTKTDLLSPDDVARAHAVVAQQLERLGLPPVVMPMLSSHFYVGVLSFWRRIVNEIGRQPLRVVQEAEPAADPSAAPRSQKVETGMVADERALYAARTIRKRGKCKRAGAA